MVDVAEFARIKVPCVPRCEESGHYGFVCHSLSNHEKAGIKRDRCYDEFGRGERV